uniref:Uncharacterized protein n=1 Tax=Coccidioides posadasii RMSCC 3488 TaxID=454284 RepID=A0A0J6F581_COCPO|nr:hypothetical protein CPAG_04403 [Coccidioides posadasii RMSCC 3488]
MKAGSHEMVPALHSAADASCSSAFGSLRGVIFDSLHSTVPISPRREPRSITTNPPTMPIQLNPAPADDSGDKQSASRSNSSSSDSQQSTQCTASSATGMSEHGTGTEGQLSREEADRLYEERMEEEYAKREGGA